MLYRLSDNALPKSVVAVTDRLSAVTAFKSGHEREEF